MLLTTPSPITNQPSGGFRFRCVHEYRCTYLCAVHVSEATPQFTPCYGSWSATNLRSSVNYIFSVIATDVVGNVGNVVTYTWRIGKLLKDLRPLVIKCSYWWSHDI